MKLFKEAKRLQKLAGINELIINNPNKSKFKYPFIISILEYKDEVLEKINDFIDDFEEMGGEWEFIPDPDNGEFKIEKNEYVVEELCSIILVPKICLNDFLLQHPYFKDMDGIYNHNEMNFITYDMGSYIYYVYS